MPNVWYFLKLTIFMKVGSNIYGGNKYILWQLFHYKKMEGTISVMRNKTDPRLKLFMTKYEPHSCSKIVIAVEAISSALVVAISGPSGGL